MRSKLFVPGSRPELFDKALASQADAISIDLEDAVVESLKPEARENVRKFLLSAGTAASGKVIIVRVNAIGSAHFEADIAAITQPALAMVNVPKPDGAADILRAAAILEQAEAANGIHAPVTILANIESPEALQRAAEIASAHPRVTGLQLGYADLFEPCGIDRRDSQNVHAAMFAMRMAAAAAGVFAYDGAFASVQDEEGFIAEAAMARRLGYLGKSCVHPSQIALANDAFRPSDEDIAFSLRVLDAAEQARLQQLGAFAFDGRMIDLPFIRRAEAVVAVARKLKLIA